jgi:competence protein ComEC
MSERAVATLAVLVWLAAAAALAVPVGLVVASALLAVLVWCTGRRRATVVVVGLLIALLTSGRAASSWERLDAPLPRSFAGPAVVRTDPEDAGAGVRVVLDTSTGRLDATAAGPPAVSLGRLSVGDRLVVTGRVSEWSGSPSRRSSLHLRGRLAVETVAPSPAAPAPWWQLANAARGVVAAGADALPAGDRALYRGLVYGDDRGQPPVTAADFAASGLTHLLAVSGQNVAFVVLAAGPLLRCFGYRGRWVAVAAVLALFGAVTRFEPSVLRAVTMALVAATADLLGRESSAVRSLAVTVILLLLIDPVLVGSIGFRLSVAATAGIVLLGPRLAERLVGPQPVRIALATTMAAQLGVSPLLVSTFGPVGVVAVPANLLAAPAAGFLMTWGLTVGPLAGLIGGVPGQVLQLPALAALRWLGLVARVAADLPVGAIGWATLALLAPLVAAWLWARAPWRARGGVVGLLVVCGVAGYQPGPPDGVHHLDVGAAAHVADGVTLLTLDGRADPERTLRAARALGVRAFAAVVVTGGSERPAHVVGALRARIVVGVVFAASERRIPGARSPPLAGVSVGPWRVCWSGTGSGVRVGLGSRVGPVACGS